MRLLVGFNTSERLAASCAFVLLAAGPIAGCAEVVSEPGSGECTETTTVACANSLTNDNSILDWELVVDPKPIVAGETFSASLDGKAIFGESFLDEAQKLIRGGVREVDLIDLNATVQVRSGAVGDDVTLTVDSSYEYECFIGKAECDPANGNADCDQTGGLNPCGRYILLPISSDCGSDGMCAELGKTGPNSQCDLNDFCITGDLVLPLEEQTGRYTASATEAYVLIGWADQTTGFELRESGPNEGTWILTMPSFADEPGPVSLRISVGGIPIALECTMGVDSRGPCGVDSLDFFSSLTPHEALIRFPIEPNL